MKAIIIIINLGLAFLNCNAFANPPRKLNDCVDTPRLVHYNSDTAQYLIKDFNDSSYLYVNKPLIALLKKIEIAPTFFLGLGSLRESDSIRLVTIYFVNWNRYNHIMSHGKLDNVYRLEVTFEKPFAAADFDLMQRNANMQWSRVVRNYMGSRIIKQFKFYRR